MALYWKRYVIPSYSFTFTLGHYNYTLFLIKCSWTPQLLNYHINTDDFILILKNKHDIYKKLQQRRIEKDGYSGLNISQ